MQGICARLPITTSQGFQRDKVESNSTGADFDDASLAAYLDEIKFQESLVKVVRRLSEIRKSIVVFTRFVKEAEHLASQVESCEIVTAETPAKERDRLINDWKDGKIKTLANVGILTTGVDYPELETVVLARPTKSLALYYQMLGRTIRTHPNKKDAWCVDMTDNLSFFGKVEDFHIGPNHKGLWELKSGNKTLTNVYLSTTHL